MENHLNICNQFVPYELAVKLKELGFDEKCLAVYTEGKLYTLNWVNHDLITKAPLWQQAFEWFSEEYKINNFTHRYIDDQWCFEIFRDDFSDCLEMYFSTKEEARYSCLEKLIELIQNKNDRSI